MAHNSGSCGSTPSAGDECGLQVRPMGLKVHYTFDKDNQERCLARWPHILHVQTIPMDGQTIGVVDLGLCLQAVAQCSPEVAGDEDKDYAIYAFDYSEPDTPLVGQGLLSRGLSQGSDPQESKLITGRVAKNVLAIFGNGIKETLEVRLKLTAISKISRNDSTPRPQSATILPPNLTMSSSTISDNGEWGSFVQSHPDLGHRQSAPPVNLPTLAPAPVRPYSSSFGARNDVPQQYYPPIQPAPSSRPGSVDPGSKGRNTPSLTQNPLLAPARQSPTIEEPAPSQSTAKAVKPQTQSRPNSRASSRPPTGRPRGRPRKRPLASEGNTSGYEDGTDGDDAPSRAKKRATTTKVERSNTATFGSVPESLRVAASTAGSIRNFRPIAPGDASAKSHLQEGPRAPTPVPESRFQGHSHPRPILQSSLRRQSIASQMGEGVPNTAYLDPNRSISQDARSPTDSAAPSPYSDDPSPADISSSPPVPRSAMYSVQSSPAPSSPILPPMPAPMQQPDSGFMSGGLEDNRTGDDIVNKTSAAAIAPAPMVAKPKPRRSRARKQEPKIQQTLHIHTETPGPPELLPQTSIYNPPRSQASKNRPTTETLVTTEAPAVDSINSSVRETIEPGLTEDQQAEKNEQPQPALPPQIDFAALEAVLVDFPDGQQFLDSFSLEVGSFSPADDTATQESGILPLATSIERRMEPPAVPTPAAEPSVEPELPAVPASDPVLPQLIQSMHMSEGLHPQTDAVDGMESRMNKNYVKRQAIKQKLEEAVALGQMPSFCSNCGALQTPTWRKIWKQERRGTPAYHEYSEKPGHVTAINVLERDDGGSPILYEVIKKSLGQMDDKSTWTETILCNPCGIWFSKWKAHRPPEKWEKDEQRLTQTRKKRAIGGGTSRSRKGRAKSDVQMNFTSEACLPTDPTGPADSSQSPKETAAMTFNADQTENASEKGSERNRKRTAPEAKDQGSTHSRTSRASGTAMSPINLDEELGATRRLLFPSPRKDGEQKILGEVAVNIVQTSPRAIEIKDGETAEKKNNRARGQTPEAPNHDFADLFGPTPRPLTPPPKATNSGPFKTPTRPTPSHRPITRSVSKSMRSTKSLTSPTQALLDRTPTRTPSRTPRKTPRSAFLPSVMRRRSPRHLLPVEAMGDNTLGTPLTHSISQMFSDTDHLVMPSPSRGYEIDFSSLPHIDNIDQHSGLHFDFTTLLSTDPLMASSPPLLQNGEILTFGGSLTFDMDVQNLDLRSIPRDKRREMAAVKQETDNAQHAT
ncbi:hypothetical protein F5Y19DRAFT_274381 [Xylariaceae sp. FL1651]|nr:hypothetical protein F5Y19DRAFT_274381 [Xylariaceae sp. FL1651]